MICVYCAATLSGGPGGWHDQTGREVCPSGKSSSTFHEPAAPAHADLHWAHQVCFDQLHFCGCGNPELVFDLVCEILATMPLFEDGNRQKVEQLVGGNESATEWMLHVLTDADLIEHGGSVRGSWITPKGERLLALRYQFEGGIDPEDGYFADCTPACPEHRP